MTWGALTRPTPTGASFPLVVARVKVLGATDIDEVIELLSLKVDSEEIEAETVGGMVTEKMGRIPKPGEKLEIGGFTVLVTASDDRHVSTLEFLAK